MKQNGINQNFEKLTYKPHSTLCIFICENDITYIKAMSNHLKLYNFIAVKIVQKPYKTLQNILSQ